MSAAAAGTFSGMLRKQGHDMMGTWSDRWCVLEDGTLSYYKKPNTPALGALQLEVSRQVHHAACRLMSLPQICELSKNGKVIVLQFDRHEKGEGRAYRFMSEVHQQMQRRNQPRHSHAVRGQDSTYIDEWFRVLQESQQQTAAFKQKHDAIQEQAAAKKAEASKAAASIQAQYTAHRDT